ncbi:MAG: septum formation protein Maf [Betaproteobacteria bacterium RBG_16_64_18]|nr:MAG: septum formation protein Maf [Betaproteobacteria bacterium RBG_16_64_18]OGA08092.1 MAG: septum formation protein Maf [Betaproteobacteria bacterium RIFCSPLOWO2_02_FULL_65_20]OGA37146.1 MAG: septum formation protein Maf [Betaproteobacteria bacterium RIFCSPLOWO2_12_FULL_65_110]
MPVHPFGFKVYLASRSPRRRELLRQIGIEFELLLLREQAPRGPDVSETVYPGESAADFVRRACRTKARAAWGRVEERRIRSYPVLAADTVVSVEGVLLGKPADHADAARMLGLLSGKTHQVLTAVAMQFGDRIEMALSESTVRFRELGAPDIAAYVDSGEPMDKAGAYAIQGRAAAFIPELRGSYSGVMGLPLYETAELARLFKVRSA